jgi:DNA-binding CsgD family transcriptional regulator
MFNRHLEHMKASLAIAAGRTEEGVEQMLALGEREIEIGWPGPSQFPWRSEAALALRALGEGSEARRLAGEELRRARDFGAPRAYGIALRAWALVADPEDRSPALRRAVDVLEGSGATLEHARALIDLGTAVRHDRHPTAARPMLRQGHELAARCGADRLVEHAYRELLAAGVRARRTASHGPGSLTASEHRVAGLAAQELSNREIAQALFVTEKTVETHLSHVYSKLGLRSRKELSAALTSTAE